MLSELRLSNFRIFDDEVTIRFRPITILIGKNNAGKSSIIKFLLMLQQSCSARGGPFLVVRGGRVNLGRIYDLKNARSRKRSLKFFLRMRAEVTPSDPVGSHLLDRSVDVGAAGYEVAADVRYNKQGAFRGNGWGVSLLVERRRVAQSLSLLTENSRFLDIEDARRKPAEREVADATSLTVAMRHCARMIGQDIEAIEHISPVKEDLPRTIDTGEDMESHSVGQHGDHALHHLHRLWGRQDESNDDKDRYEFVLNHLDKVLDVRDIDFPGQGDLAQCEVVNSKTGNRVNLADFGFGVSQCLPIFVQGAMMYPGTTLMVEQPEAQVHPTAQLDLGSFLASLWGERKVGSIVETHSSNLLLRLRHLIAKGDGYLRPDDVSIAFFDIKEGKATVKNLDINRDGHIGEGLPMEFFGADVKEGLDLSAAKYGRPGHEDE